MSVKFNGTTITDIIYNNTELCKLIYNGTLVYENHALGNWVSSHSSDTHYKVCSKCSEKFNETAHDDIYIKDVQFNADDSYNGYEGSGPYMHYVNRWCRTCDYQYRLDLEKCETTGMWRSTEVVAPTCTTQGYTIKVCDCGVTYDGTSYPAFDIKPALGHSYSITYTWDTAGSCTGTATCTRCGDVQTETRMGTYTVVTPGTCMDEVTYKYIVSNAWTNSLFSGAKESAVYTGDKNPNNHTALSTGLGGYDATCTSVGYYSYSHCDDCGKYYNSNGVETTLAALTIPAKGHDWIVTYDWNGLSSCTATRTCRNDSSHKETATATITSKVTTAATCTEDGMRTYTATFSASWAETQKSYQVLDKDPDNHSKTTKSFTKKASSACQVWDCCGATYTTHSSTYGGTENVHTKCSRSGCGVTLSSGHSISSSVTAPTCTESGYTTKTCYCGYSYTTDYTNPLGHTWNNTTYSWNGTSSCTATRTCKNNSSHTETSTATITSKVTTAATCTTKGTTTYTATFSDSWAATQTKTAQDVAIVSTAHSWKTPTYSGDGKSSYTATRVCNHNSGHTESATATITSSVTTAATCTTTGVRTYKADFSQSWATDKTTTESIAATGHSWNSPTYSGNGISSYTATRTCKNNSSHTQTATATITSKVTTPATCTTKGTTTYTASFSETWATGKTTTSQDVAIDSSNHNLVYVAKVDATCTEAGHYAYYYCNRSGCGKYFDSKQSATTWAALEIPAKGHTAGAAATCTSVQTCTVCSAQLAAKNPNNHSGSKVESSRTNATCTTNGTIYYKYNCCQASAGTSSIPATGHSYTSKVTTTATCSSTGVRTYTCGNDSSHTYTETIAKNASNHSNRYYVDYVAPTCTENGHSAYYYCSGCKKYYDINYNETSWSNLVISAKGHTEVTDAAVAATCTQTGLTAGKHCSVCGTITEAQTVVAAKGHTPGPAATCSSVQICTVCSTQLAGKNADNHSDMISSGAGSPTCTTTGWNAYKYCYGCSQYFDTNGNKTTWSALEIPATGHSSTYGGTSGVHTYCSTCQTTLSTSHTYNVDSGVQYTAATCAAKRKNYLRCACGYNPKSSSYTTSVGSVSTTNHVSYTYRSTVSPTCTAVGYDIYKCYCGNDTFYDNYVDALGHDEISGGTSGVHTKCNRCGVTTSSTHYYSDSVTAPTCTSQGYTTKSCTCGYSYNTNYTSATGHDYSSEVTVTPTCSSTGMRKYTCSTCGNSYSQVISKDASNHSDLNTYGGQAATCTESGYNAYSYCYGCQKYYTFSGTETTWSALTIPAKGHTEVTDAAVAATCISTGLTAGKHCSVCGTVTEAQTTVAKLSHDYNIEGGVAIQPTCTENGWITYYCGNGCSGTTLREWPNSAKGHSLTTGYQGSGFEDGHYTYQYCTACDWSEDPWGGSGYEAHVYNGSSTCTRCGESCSHPYSSLSAFTNYSGIHSATCNKCGTRGVYSHAAGSDPTGRCGPCNKG